ncbi:MAG: hypothetical protein H7Z75_06100, partial [Ferruginibacter sp.]|nr:hypothetical protein [Cytophagales bacterium]
MKQTLPIRPKGRPMDRHRRGLSKWVAAVTLTLCFGIPGFAQNRVSGTVTSGGDNSALPGVSVLVKGT